MKRFSVILFAVAFVIGISGVANATLLYENTFDNNSPFIDSHIQAILEGGNVTNTADTSYNEKLMEENYLLAGGPNDGEIELELTGVSWLEKVVFNLEIFGTWDTSGQLKDIFEVEIYYENNDNETSLLEKEWLFSEGDNLKDLKLLINEYVIGTLDIEWEADVTGKDEMFGIDNIRVYGEPVPEPGTIVLLGSGLLGLVAYGRRRKRTRS